MVRKARIHFPGAIYQMIARGTKTSDLPGQSRFSDLSLLPCGIQIQILFPSLCLCLDAKSSSPPLGGKKGALKVPLSKIMQVLQIRYTRYFNRKYGVLDPKVFRKLGLDG